MITFKIKDLFFDRKRVLDAMDRATARALSKAGAFVRRRARSSMRKRKSASAAGSPPSVHAGQLKDLLYFGYDPAARSVVVGPVTFNGRRDYEGPPVPNLEEFGGTVILTKPRWITSRFGRGKRAGTTRIKLAAGTKLTYPARPFMGPALEAEIAAGTMPREWSNALRAA